jgi:adenine-specific DNA-methyltransferase
MTQKLKMKTPDLTQANIEKIAELFPNVITEIAEEDGKLKKGIDFDLLKQALSDVLVEDENERYRLDWPGKKKSLLKANTPINKTLRPCREESLNFDTTENLYIEGDNFEVLKILQESYLGKVKMIYIDPPYNRGDDLIYKDDYKVSKEEYEEELGAYDEESGRLFKNTDSNGRFHSDWLSMMYERLVIARDLLKDDGVIFISIDDNEVHNLRKICDEIFGEENIICDIVREVIRGGSKSSLIREVKDYVLAYSKNKSLVSFQGLEQEGFVLDLEDEKGKYKKGRELNKWGAGSRREDSPGMWFPVPGPDGEEVYPTRNDGSEGRWRLGRKKIFDLIERGEVIYEKRQDSTYIIYEKIRDDSPRNKQFTSLFLKEYVNSRGTDTFKKLFRIEKSYFDYVKPIELIYDLLLMSTSDDDIVLDFFSGSATTAHTVLKFNANNDTNLKFIMVQLPEKLIKSSEAYKAGYKTIPEIGKERIRRAGKTILEELESKNQQLKLGEEAKDTSKLDVGFRVYKLDESNMKDVYYHPNQVNQDQLSLSISNIKDGRTAEDLLTQVILDLGLELNLPIEVKNIKSNNVFFVQGNSLVACFDDSIDFGIVDEIAKAKPLRVVFKDAGFRDDKDRINLEERFKRLSPETQIRVI